MEASVPPTQIRLDLPQQQAKQRTIGRTKRKVQRLLQIEPTKTNGSGAAHVHAVSIDKLKSESPTTNSWFDVAQVLAREGEDWDEFRSRFADAAGIPLKTSG